jgi:RNA polymerase sigma-70 factor (ECF subfamily)
MNETADRSFERWRRTGDAGALADVFDAIAPRLLRLAVHLAGDMNAAEDLVQATFVAAIESAPAWDPSRPLEPWLTGILENRAKELHKSRRRPLEPFAREDVDHETPLSRAIDSENSAGIAKALDQLEEPYRGVLVLSVMHGMEPAAIAHALGRSPGAVRVQLHRGREMLRKSLPAGIVAGALLVSGSARGMTAIKAAVLLHAAASVAPSAMLAAGGTLVLKKIVLVAAGIVVLTGGVVLVASVGPKEQDVRSVRAPEETKLDARADPGAAPQPVQSTSARQPATGTAGTLVVSGRVVNVPYAGIPRSAAPASDCKIEVITECDHCGAPKVTTTQTDDGGSFRVEVPRPAGKALHLVVACPSDAVFHGADDEREIVPKVTSVSDIVLTRTVFGTLHGITVDDHGTALPGVRVRFEPTVRVEPAIESVSDEHGKFELHPSRELYGAFAAELEGWALYRWPDVVALKTGGYADETLVLAPVGTLCVRALDAFDEPRPGVNIHVQPAEEDPATMGWSRYAGNRYEKRTDEHGMAVFDQVWTGKQLIVRVSFGGWKWWNSEMSGGRLLFDGQHGDPIVIGERGVLRIDVPR